MAVNPARQPVCFLSGQPVEGRFYNTGDGPVLAAYYEEYKQRYVKPHQAPLTCEINLRPQATVTQLLARAPNGPRVNPPTGTASGRFV